MKMKGEGLRDEVEGIEEKKLISTATYDLRLMIFTASRMNQQR